MKKLLFIFYLFSLANCFSQTTAFFRADARDDDYLFLKNDTTPKSTTQAKKGRSYISYGGEVRFQYFYAHNEGWGDDPKDNDGYILSRFLAHADLHAGEHFRAFAQLQSSLSGSRISPSPVDDNPLELHQAFFDIKANVSSGSTLTFRAGRQELSYGSQRLVAVRERPNNRQSFDALKAQYTSGNYQIDAFYSYYVAARENIFDDGFNQNVKFWGAYITRTKVPVLKNIDLYYFGLWKRNAKFDDGSAREIRHSAGIRIWNNNGNWKYDLEALYQFGAFGVKDISAWTASINTSYTFTKATFKPEVGLKAELISGDKEYNDSKLQTFNPLFPRGAYFGLASLIGPANLIDAHPSVSFHFSKTLQFDIDYDIFWRYSANDGLYFVNVSLIYSGKMVAEKHIGNQLAGNLIYKPNDFVSVNTEFTWFNAGGFLKAAGAGKDIIFTGLTVQVKF